MMIRKEVINLMRVKRQPITILLPQSFKDFRKLGYSDLQILELANQSYIIKEQRDLRKRKKVKKKVKRSK